MSTTTRPPKSPPNVVHETQEGDYIAVPIGRGIVVWHTHEEWQRFLKGVDVEASMLLGEAVVSADDVSEVEARRPTEDRLAALRSYYTGNTDGAGDVEDLFHEIDTLRSALDSMREELAGMESMREAAERERDSMREERDAVHQSYVEALAEVTEAWTKFSAAEDG